MSSWTSHEKARDHVSLTAGEGPLGSVTGRAAELGLKTHPARAIMVLEAIGRVELEATANDFSPDLWMARRLLEELPAESADYEQAQVATAIARATNKDQDWEAALKLVHGVVDTVPYWQALVAYLEAMAANTRSVSNDFFQRAEKWLLEEVDAFREEQIDWEHFESYLSCLCHVLFLMRQTGHTTVDEHRWVEHIDRVWEVVNAQAHRQLRCKRKLALVRFRARIWMYGATGNSEYLATAAEIALEKSLRDDQAEVSVRTFAVRGNTKDFEKALRRLGSEPNSSEWRVRLIEAAAHWFASSAQELPMTKLRPLSDAVTTSRPDFRARALLAMLWSGAFKEDWISLRSSCREAINQLDDLDERAQLQYCLALVYLRNMESFQLRSDLALQAAMYILPDTNAGQALLGCYYAAAFGCDRRDSGLPKIHPPYWAAWI